MTIFLIFSLLPHRTNSIDGKKHVRTVPVRLRKAQNDEHSKHEGNSMIFLLNLDIFMEFFRWTFCYSNYSLY
jgi:hypothetical protein